MSALFLTDEELQELTDCARKREQIQWLKARRYPFEVTAKGRPVVLRAFAEQFDWARPKLTGPRPRLTLDEETIVSLAVPVDDLCGIYFLVRDARVVYVGQSTNVFRRVAQHMNNGMEFDAYHFLPVPVHELDKVEDKYIRLLKPKLNKRGAKKVTP